MDMVGCLLDNDFPGRVRVDGTGIRVDSLCGEGVGDALTSLQDGRFLELIVCARDRRWYIVACDPGDF